MTDKQIIINKMDKPKRYCEGIDCAWCNEKEPCIYKIANELEEKLLRKEQECEELKKQHQGDKGLITSTGKMNYQLIQEYDKLKTDKVEALEQLEFVRTLNTIREAENRKLEQTLTEIKEIAEEDFNHTCWKTYARQLKQILQKISEVEECKP